jgi:hypothetical protein
LTALTVTETHLGQIDCVGNERKAARILEVALEFFNAWLVL